jgi:collagen type II alpha
MSAQNDIFFRRGSSSNWSSVNPTLRSAELGYDTTEKKFKIGDGTTPWNSLDWASNIGVSGEAIFPEAIYDVSGIFFDTSFGSVDQVEGQLNWNNETGTIDVGLTQDLTMHVGQDIFFRVKNSTGSPITKGEPVAATGVIGGGEVVQVAPFAVDGSVDEIRFIGLVADDIANGDDGYVVQFGHVKNVDLRTANTTLNPNGETWAVGDILFVDDSSAGGLTKVQPKDDIYVAMVLADGQNGELLVRITDPGHINELHDVNTSGVVDGSFLVWDSGNETWQNSNNLTYIDNVLYSPKIIMPQDDGSITDDFGAYIQFGGDEIDIGTSIHNIALSPGEIRIETDGKVVIDSVSGCDIYEKLHVYSSTSGDNVFTVEGTNGSLFGVTDSLSGTLMSVNTIAGLPVLEVNADYSVVAGRFNQSDFVITTSGDVGIGTANPTEKLHVAGDARITGAFYDSSNSAGSSTKVLLSTGTGTAWTEISTAALQGLQGIQGIQGIQGSTGSQGGQGLQGLQGIQGSTGGQGGQGLQGLQGIQGITGGQGGQGVQGLQGIQGSTGSQGGQGLQGLQGIQGRQGIQGSTGTQGGQGLQGLQGIQGRQGVQGIQGTQGIQGITGRDGNFGGATFDYTFSTSTTNSDPGTGILRLNNSVASSATALYIDDLDDNSTDIQLFLRTIADSTSTLKGHFRISNKFNADDFAFFTISNISEQTGYFIVNCAYVTGTTLYGSGTFSNGEDIVITFARTGDKGDTGLQGIQGIQGNYGIQGRQGIQGSQGIQGIQGIQGSTGSQGGQGLQGIQGRQGIQGSTGSQGDQGVQGLQGIQGRQGIQGSTGSQGGQGLQGLQGIQGSTGSQGGQGLQGLQGIQGRQGIQGSTGSQGGQGVQGLQGIQGRQGVQGITGPVAGSANQVVYKDGSNNPTGSADFTYNGTTLYVADEVGINKTSPNATLHVYSATSGADIFNVEGTNGSLFSIVDSLSGSLMSVNNIVGLPIFEVFDDDTVIAGRYGENDFYLSTSGDIGLGTSNPTEKLHVDGNIRVSGAFYDSSNNPGSSTKVLLSTGTGTSWTEISTAALQGLQGIQGRQGIQGSTGSQGGQGLQGLQGIQGRQGVQGVTGGQGGQGTQGLQGIQGRTGSQGGQGVQGLQGIQGSTGGQGGQGVQGLQGIQGRQGSTGGQGGQGLQGLQGIQGSTGGQGGQGLQGLQGIQGRQGSTGGQGGQGLQGLQGIQGITGGQGGQGVQGLQGIQGRQGSTGGQGGQGLQGLQGIQGSTGGQGGQGVQGLQGIQGRQGITGPVAGSANQVVYKNGSNVPTGSANFTFDGDTLYAATEVGINATSPNATLHVYSATIGDTIFNAEGTNGSLFSIVDNLTGTLMSVNNNAGLPIFEVFDDDTVVAGRYAQNDFVVTTSGDIGIGTANPTEKLHVVGDARITGALYDSSNSAGSSTKVLLSTGTGTSWTEISTAALQGLQGIQGRQGITGSQGGQGTQGIQGIQGRQGITGSQGGQGTQGIQGIQGRQGITGSQGGQGTQGIQGIQGRQGITGPVAGSANQVVYKNASNVASGSASFTFTETGTSLQVDNLKLDGNTLSSTNTNGNVIITPNGTGGIAAGANATATGGSAVVGGGYSNTASGNYSTVSGGYCNTASAILSTVSGGYLNCATGYASTVGGGGGVFNGNTASGSYSTVGGGYGNCATATNATAAGGFLNCASGNGATVSGGTSNCASGIVSTISGGTANCACATNSSISGGRNNFVNARHGSINGGHYNVIQSPTNECCSRGATIGGGIGHNTTGGTVNSTTGDITGTVTCCNAGRYSTISGGYRNIATGTYSTVSGGDRNIAGFASTVSGGILNCASGGGSYIGGGTSNNVSSPYSVIGGGFGNTASGYYSIVGGGYDNTASGYYYSTVVGGFGNTASGYLSIVGGGLNNCATGYASTVSGGSFNYATANQSTVVGGYYAKASRYGEVAHAAGRFAQIGDAQHSTFVARKNTTDATANVELFIDGVSGRMTLTAETTWTFNIKLSAYNDTDNTAAWWIFRGGIRRNAANGTALIGSLIEERDYEGTMSGTSAAVTADDTNESLKIAVTGLASKNIRWVAVVDVAQVSWGTP